MHLRTMSDASPPSTMTTQPQWQGFLHAMVAEFEEALPTEELRLLMHRIGERFAHQHALPPCRTVEALQATINDLWARMGWGRVEFTEQYAKVAIMHFDAPISSHFGSRATWGACFLEGAYQAWLVRCGMPYGLQVSLDTDIIDAQDAETIVLKMARER